MDHISSTADGRIVIAAHKLAIRFTEDVDLPARYRNLSSELVKSRKLQKIKEDSEIEKRFKIKVESWAQLIEIMLSKVDIVQAWRFIDLCPQLDGTIDKVTDNKDFCDFVDYTVLRRDVEQCQIEELGGLCLLSVAFQREVEKRLRKKPEMKKSATSDRIAVIDVETTGLSPWRHDRIVEIAIVIISPDGTIHTEYETLVNPTRDMGPSRIHQISAADVLRAPTFAGIAGDVMQILRDVSAVAGHNVSFDMNFLVKEYERLGVSLPSIPLLCTCRLFGRNNLRACCDELDISFDGTPHQAISDARATAQIVSYKCADDPALLDNYRLENPHWPSVAVLNTPCFRREHAKQAREEPPRFLERITCKIHHDVEAETPNILAYMALIDRVLEDRTIDECEENALVDAALSWQLSGPQLETVHKQYIHNLAVVVLADGVVTDSERRDLHLVSKLLGQDDSTLDVELETAAAQLASARRIPALPQNDKSLCGLRVCFTGELQTTIDGQPITRDLAEILAIQAGLIVASSVTKKLDILVVADPNTQSGKATKARSLGIRILSDAVFFRMAGIAVD